MTSCRRIAHWKRRWQKWERRTLAWKATTSLPWNETEIFRRNWKTRKPRRHRKENPAAARNSKRVFGRTRGSWKANTRCVPFLKFRDYSKTLSLTWVNGEDDSNYRLSIVSRNMKLTIQDLPDAHYELSRFRESPLLGIHIRGARITDLGARRQRTRQVIIAAAESHILDEEGKSKGGTCVRVLLAVIRRLLN